MLLKCAAREDLRVPWTARRSNQSIIKEINPKYSLEGLMLKLKFQYFGHLMQITDSLEKTLMLGRLKAEVEGGDRGWDGWMASSTQWTWVRANFRRYEGQGNLACYSPWGQKESDMTEWLNNNKQHINVYRYLSLYTRSRKIIVWQVYLYQFSHWKRHYSI